MIFVPLLDLRPLRDTIYSKPSPELALPRFELSPRLCEPASLRTCVSATTAFGWRSGLPLRFTAHPWPGFSPSGPRPSHSTVSASAAKSEGPRRSQRPILLPHSPAFNPLDTLPFILYYANRHCHSKELLVLAFFGNSWALWWLVAIVAILRWFHLLANSSIHVNDSSPNRHGGPSQPSFKLPHPSSL
jgi:hypothetical protein